MRSACSRGGREREGEMDANPTLSARGERRNDDVRGAGGKFRKPARKLPASPYTSPPAVQPVRVGWLSKLVDPAYRLISGGANKIFPSLFSRLSSISFPLVLEENHDERDTAVAPNTNDDEKCTSDHVTSKVAEATNPSETAETFQKTSEHDEPGKDKQNSPCYESEVSRIEQLMRGKLFSRDKVNRLTEILRSRIFDQSDMVQEKKDLSVTAGEDSKNDPERHICTRSFEGKEEFVGRSTVRSLLTPHAQTNEIDVGSSPIDIAKAYMGRRMAEQIPEPSSLVTKGEDTLQLSDEYVLRPPSSKPSTCWPGAVIQDNLGYVTPHSQRGTYGFQDFPRTPYSRTTLWKSRTKTPFQADSRPLNISSSPFRGYQTSIYGQVKQKNDVLDNGYGTVGPIRRIRSKFASETRPRGSIFLNDSKLHASPFQKPRVSSTAGVILEAGETSGTSMTLREDHLACGSEGLNSSPSEAVRKILEHLDRGKPTPKEKEAELKLATAWRKSPSPEGSNAMPDGKVNIVHLGEFAFHKNTDLLGLNSAGYTSEINSNFQLKLRTNESVRAEDVNTRAPTLIVGGSSIKNDNKVGPSVGLTSTPTSKFEGSNEMASIATNDVQKERSQLEPLHCQPNRQEVTGISSLTNVEPSKKPPRDTSGSKPILPSIFINEPNPRNAVSCDNFTGFTFPVTSSSGALSEPPTPSISPMSSASTASHRETSTVPQYSFGTNKSFAHLVFTFPSIRSSTMNTDVSDIKFSFGSDKSTRLCFNLLGKDAICC